MKFANPVITIDRQNAISNLKTIRTEWQEAASSHCLIEVNGSIGLLLADIATALELTEQESVEVLGTDQNN